MSRKIVGLNRIKHKIQQRLINEVNSSLKKQYGIDLKIENSYKKVVYRDVSELEYGDEEELEMDYQTKKVNDGIIEASIEKIPMHELEHVNNDSK